ncbi:MAG: helix-turn-helix domain-containing protein [Candidatus Pacearchaeota archaeon]
MSEKNILIPLGDEKLKDISEVISNKTCNKILDFLVEEEATISDVSKKLSIPINTAEYNIKKLTKTGLIEKKSHFWSVKGKKMPVYVVSNKKIIISPKRSKSLLSLILALGLTGFFALIIKKTTSKISENIVAPEEMILKADRFAEATAQHPEILSTMAPWEWFLIGAWLAIIFFFVISSITERRKK